MASAIEHQTLFGEGVQTGFEGYGPAVRATIKGQAFASGDDIAVIRIPKGSIPRNLVMRVVTPTAAACTVDVGHCIGPFGSDETFDNDSIESTGTSIAAAGYTTYALDATPAVVTTEKYLTITANAAIDSGAELQFTLFCDIVDPLADIEA